MLGCHNHALRITRHNIACSAMRVLVRTQESVLFSGLMALSYTIANLVSDIVILLLGTASEDLTR
jgi:hypothetical protein